MELLKDFMANIMKEFGPINKESIIAAAVGLVALIIFLFILEKRRKEEEKYDEDMTSRDERMIQPTEPIEDPLPSPSEPCSSEQDDEDGDEDDDEDDGDDEDDDDDDDDEQEDYTSVLAECRERVSDFLKKLDFLQNVYVEYFDEDLELSGEGYMYALIRFFLDGYESWIIFYPNSEYNMIMMVYNKRISDDKVTEIADAIDHFYYGNWSLIGDEDDCPALLWDDDNNYSSSSLIDDLIRAVERSFVWEELLKQFRDDQ